MDPQASALRQSIIDEEHLRLLPVFYWVLGAVNVFVALYGLVYVSMGVFFLAMPPEESTRMASGGSPATLLAWFFIGIGMVFTVGFGLVAALQIASGFWIRARRRRTLCLVTAGLSCVFVPFGTVLGVLTFMALRRPSVSALFDTPPNQVPLSSTPSA